MVADVVATSRGYRIYTTDPFEKVSESKDGDIATVEMLFSTSLVALVLSPRKLRMLHTKVSSSLPLCPPTELCLCLLEQRPTPGCS